jgi:hypothetical protein
MTEDERWMTVKKKRLEIHLQGKYTGFELFAVTSLKDNQTFFLCDHVASKGGFPRQYCIANVWTEK